MKCLVCAKDVLIMVKEGQGMGSDIVCTTKVPLDLTTSLCRLLTLPLGDYGSELTTHHFCSKCLSDMKTVQTNLKELDRILPVLTKTREFFIKSIVSTNEKIVKKESHKKVESSKVSDYDTRSNGMRRKIISELTTEVKEPEIVTIEEKKSNPIPPNSSSVIVCAVSPSDKSHDKSREMAMIPMTRKFLPIEKRNEVLQKLKASFKMEVVKNGKTAITSSPKPTILPIPISEPKIVKNKSSSIKSSSSLVRKEETAKKGKSVEANSKLAKLSIPLPDPKNVEKKSSPVKLKSPLILREEDLAKLKGVIAKASKSVKQSIPVPDPKTVEKKSSSTSIKTPSIILKSDLVKDKVKEVKPADAVVKPPRLPIPALEPKTVRKKRNSSIEEPKVKQRATRHSTQSTKKTRKRRFFHSDSDDESDEDYQTTDSSNEIELVEVTPRKTTRSLSLREAKKNTEALECPAFLRNPVKMKELKKRAMKQVCIIHLNRLETWTLREQKELMNITVRGITFNQSLKLPQLPQPPIISPTSKPIKEDQKKNREKKRGRKPKLHKHEKHENPEGSKKRKQSDDLKETSKKPRVAENTSIITTETSKKPREVENTTFITTTDEFSIIDLEPELNGKSDAQEEDGIIYEESYSMTEAETEEDDTENYACPFRCKTPQETGQWFDSRAAFNSHLVNVHDCELVGREKFEGSSWKEYKVQCLCCDNPKMYGVNRLTYLAKHQKQVKAREARKLAMSTLGNRRLGKFSRSNDRQVQVPSESVEAIVLNFNQSYNNPVVVNGGQKEIEDVYHSNPILIPDATEFVEIDENFGGDGDVVWDFTVAHEEIVINSSSDSPEIPAFPNYSFYESSFIQGSPIKGHFNLLASHLKEQTNGELGSPENGTVPIKDVMNAPINLELNTSTNEALAESMNGVMNNAIAEELETIQVEINDTPRIETILQNGAYSGYCVVRDEMFIETDDNTAITFETMLDGNICNNLQLQQIVYQTIEDGSECQDLLLTNGA